VHNGWKYIHEPHILHLSVDNPATSGQTQMSSNKRINLKSSFKQKSESDANTSYAFDLFLLDENFLTKIN